MLLFSAFILTYSPRYVVGEEKVFRLVSFDNGIYCVQQRTAAEVLLPEVCLHSSLLLDGVKLGGGGQLI